jgi:MFS family permease
MAEEDKDSNGAGSSEGIEAAEVRDNVEVMQDAKKHPLREIVQPFIDLAHAPRALWGINLAYVLEGMVYFGILGYLAIHFSSYVFKGVGNADEMSHTMVMVLTAGITIAMFFLGFVADKWGVRRALILAFVLMLGGRVLIAGAPTIMGLEPAGVGSALHLVTMGGIVLVVIGYGMYQPAAYAAVRKFTTPKTAAMGFAMLYALMNLGGWLPSFAFLLRDDDFAGLGIPGTFWVYTGFTALALIVTVVILSRKTVDKAIASAREETERIKAEEAAAKKKTGEAASSNEASEQAEGRGHDGGRKGEGEEGGAAEADKGKQEERRMPAPHLWFFMAAVIGAIFWRTPAPWDLVVSAAVAAAWLVACFIPGSGRWLAKHPLGDGKFFFFIFALIPVQTLFTYNWLVLPQYINRAFAGWIGDYFEVAANLNPILIFVAVPIITAMTQRAKVYNMMVWGTAIMAAPAFLLVIGPYWWTLFTYILIMTIGEAMWQPRFLQYAAEIAPEGRTGQYMGVAQLPWFLTKMVVPWLYSGWMMDRYCPKTGEQNTELMWFIYGCIAISSTVFLLVAKPWLGKDFKTKHEE